MILWYCLKKKKKKEGILTKRELTMLLSAYKLATIAFEFEE